MADNTRVDVIARRSGRGRLIALSVGLYLALSAVMFLRIRAANDHQFFFALDDPYIHLALAKSIAAGHYGINAGEAASPSSSILWPLLLVPFAAKTWGPLWALALNLLAGIGAAVVFAIAVAEWPSRDHRGDEGIRRVVSVVFLVFIGNLVGLTFLGMEHTLQVLLAGIAALGLVRVLQHREIPAWILVATALAPLVRYESLGVSLAVAIALFGRNQRKLAYALLGASIAPLIIFSLFLKHLGLPALPTSVLVKGGVQSAGAISRLVGLVAGSIKQILVPERTILLVLFLTLAGLAWFERERARRFALAGAAIAAALHMLIGRFGWFHRYEVYVVLFCALIVLYVLHERPRMLLGWFVLGLLACAGPYIEAWRTTIEGTRDTYLLQEQMHRFADSYYPGNVAINDLGLVSYGRHPDQYVLDLVGLGSAEAAKQADKSPAWMDAITEEHRVGAVMIFRSWFPRVPTDWTRVGAICLLNRPVMLPGSCVQFYATPLEPAADLRNKFIAFARTLPQGVVPIGPQESDQTALARVQ
ncbi:MAG TPA: hypothetical protein VGM11_13885 [Acidobacteriaceae bacterium]